MIATGGLSGTGKSVLAKGLAPFIAPMPGALVLRSDVERKALFGRKRTERLPPEAYRAEVSEQVYAVLNDKGQAHRARRPFGDCRRGVRQAARTRGDRSRCARGRL